MKRNRSNRSMLLDFAQVNGALTYSELHRALLTIAGQPLTRRNWGSSYLDQVSEGTTVCLPTNHDGRYLVKGTDGLYRMA